MPVCSRIMVVKKGVIDTGTNEEAAINGTVGGANDVASVDEEVATGAAGGISNRAVAGEGTGRGRRLYWWMIGGRWAAGRG